MNAERFTAQIAEAPRRGWFPHETMPGHSFNDSLTGFVVLAKPIMNRMWAVAVTPLAGGGGVAAAAKTRAGALKVALAKAGISQ